MTLAFKLFGARAERKESSVAAAPVAADLLSVMVRALGRAATRGADMLRSASVLSERSILEAGESLARLLDEGRAQNADLAALGEEFLARDDSQGANFGQVVHRVREYLRGIPGFFYRALQEIESFANQAERAQEHSQRILELAARIRRLSDTTKLLALNTRIEAMRVGDSQNAVAAVAMEMRQLASAVNEETEAIRQLGVSLGEILPAISAAARGLAAGFRERAEQVDRTVLELDRAYEDKQESVASALETSRARGERIRAQHVDILSHLQFQDRLRQDLERIEGGNGVIAKTMRELVAQLERAPDTLDLAAAEAALDRAIDAVTATDGTVGHRQSVANDRAEPGEIRFF
jgi:hypothetical protein